MGMGTNEGGGLRLGKVLAVVFLLIGAYYLGSGGSNTSNTTNVTEQENQVVTQPDQKLGSAEQTVPQTVKNIDTKKVASVEGLKACSQQANMNFNTIITAETKNQVDLREMRSFTNHLNTKDGKCYMVITGISNEAGSTLKRLYDVYDNKKLAFDWIQKNPSTGQSSDLCFITGGGDCLINKIFEEKMESSIY